MSGKIVRNELPHAACLSSTASLLLYYSSACSLPSFPSPQALQQQYFLVLVAPFVSFLMDILSSPIPQISISLAPPEEIPVEPYSPFATAGAFTLPYDDDDAFRPVHLTPPPTHTSFRKPLSPLRRSSTPTEAPKPTGKGLDQARFAALLNSSKEKVTVKKDAVDLRKEVALKAHQNKQGECREACSTNR